MDTKINYRAICGLDISKPLKEIEEKYDYLLEEKDRLQAENDRLKSEHYKDLELTALKEKCDKMEKDLLRGFPISEEEKEKINKWYDFHKMENPQREHGCLEYRFTPTLIGTFGTVICACGVQFLFQEAK